MARGDKSPKAKPTSPESAAKMKAEETVVGVPLPQTTGTIVQPVERPPKGSKAQNAARRRQREKREAAE